MKLKGSESDEYILDLEYCHFFGKEGEELSEEDPIYTI